MNSLPAQADTERARSFPLPQFRLWMLFFVTAIVAVSIHNTMEQIRLTDVRMKYHGTTDAWISRRVALGQVMAAADQLLQAERSASWISDRAAYRAYVKRLSDLLARAETSISRIPKPAAAEQRRRDCATLRDLIKRVTTEQLD